MNTARNPLAGELTTGGIPAASALLRGLATRHGLRLEPVSHVDEVAAVLAAETWCATLDTTTFEYPAAHGDTAVRTLATILARAAGYGKPTMKNIADNPSMFTGTNSEQILETTYPNYLQNQIRATAAADLLRHGFSTCTADHAAAS